MKRGNNIKTYIIGLIISLIPIFSYGQRIVSVNVDTVACLGDSVFVGIGYDSAHEVVVEDLVTAISHPGRVFLPDGIPCGSLGCSYRSPVTFSGYPSNAVISSVNDINFIRLNIEHSWIGDIYIGITCPNGQVASLMNYSNGGTSSCTSTIPQNHRGWTSGSNAPTSTFFGQAYDYGASNKCDSTQPSNAPGVGWNYCWSDNTMNGYVYAPGDGLIYRNANVHNGRIDSSNVAQGRQFYHPNESFSSLIGCPINGSWYIEVMDGWSIDNGYIFDWELSLNPSFVPSAGTVTGIDVVGNEVTRTGDSTFLVSAPAGTENDTMVMYRVLLFSSTGDTLDTAVWVHYTEHPYQLVEGDFCDGDTLWFEGTPITASVARIDSVLTTYGCLSVTEYDVRFHERYDVYDSIFPCGNLTPWYAGVPYPGAGDYLITDTTVWGCDSLTHLTISFMDSGFRAQILLSDDGELWSGDTMLGGCVPMTVWAMDTMPLMLEGYWNMGVDSATWLSGDSLTYIYDTAGVFNITHVAVSLHGCRDTVMMKNAVWTFTPPHASFSWAPENPVLSHPVAEFFNYSTPAGLSYLWLMQTNDGIDSVKEAKPFYSWARDGENVFGDFDVTLLATQTYVGPYGLPVECVDDSMATVTIVNDWLQFPNLVTPNGDGTNDIWKVVNLLECGLYSMNEVWIYNRWGTEVFHAKDISREEEFWDPDETNSPDGTYFYRFMARSAWGVVKRNGMIEVVR